MRREIFVSIALVVICCIRLIQAEPLDDLIRNYVKEFTLACQEINEISDKIEYGKKVIVTKLSNRYPYFKITDVLTLNEVKVEYQLGKEMYVRRVGTAKPDETLLKPEIEEFIIAQESLLRMMRSSLPSFSKIGKNLKLGEISLNSEAFKKELNTFKDHSIFIVRIAKYEGIPGAPDTPDELLHFGTWKLIQDSIVKLEIEEALHAFEQRYGENADKLNFVELALVNYIPPFVGNSSGPSHLEPILRVSAIDYNLDGGNFFPMCQIGLNYYFLGEGNWLFDWVHHLGIAVCAGDLQNNQLYQVKKISFGGVIHIGKYQIGVMKDIRDQNWKVISTIDFQAVPGIL